LKTVATNLTLNYLTRYRKRRRLFSELEDSPSGPPIEWRVEDSLLADIDAEQLRSIIDDALFHLPQDQRIALVLYHFDELPYQEIADRLQISLAKVKTDIRRGRVALLELLQSRGFVRGHACAAQCS
jgi:RNA polymerase sigma-70 factor (ECF subfamily)